MKTMDNSEAKSKGMIIDGIAAAETVDSSSEILIVKNADISDVHKGKMPLNWNHDPEKRGASQIVGKVLKLKKILKKEDCENDRERMYWDQVKVPYIYLIGRLYDGAKHPEAMALAAIIRDGIAHDENIICGMSVEGSTLSRNNNELTEVIVRAVAITTVECNKAAKMGLVQDPNAPEGFETKFIKENDILSELFEDHKKSEPDYLVKSPLFKYIPYEEQIDDRILAKAKQLIKKKLIKTRKELEKGAMQRLAPFNPQQEKSKIVGERRNPISGVTEQVTVGDQLSRWVDGAGSYFTREQLAQDPVSEPEKLRGLHKLHGLTSVRRNSKGEREFLLHRGYGADEAKNVFKNPNSYKNADSSSWTPHFRVAQRFRSMREKGGVASAWIPESAIGRIPRQYGNLTSPNPGKPMYVASLEHEVFVRPGEYQIHKDESLGKALSGSYNSAPGSLSGGSALQVEDQSRKKMIKARMMAAFRDYDKFNFKKDEFRDFCKNRLPEVDDDFLDYFADIAHDYTVKIKRNNPEITIRKMESLTFDLYKALEGNLTPNTLFRELGGSESKYLEPGFSTAKAKKASSVQKPKSSLIVDSAKHAHSHTAIHPEQHALIHGLDLGGEEMDRPKHAEEGISPIRFMNHGGKNIVIKNSPRTTDFKELSNEFNFNHREAIYHNMAKGFFGLGDYVPTTTAFHHPVGGQLVMAQELIPNAEHYNRDDPGKHDEILGKMHKNGELHKLAIMNHIMGNSDRHGGNYLFSDGKMKLIDHGLSLEPHSAHEKENHVAAPHYLFSYLRKNPEQSDPVHKDAQKWLQELNPQKFQEMLDSQHVPQKHRDSAIKRLTTLQERSKLNPNEPINSIFRIGE